MGKSIFVSYKYSDSLVAALPGVYVTTTARHYVDEIEKLLSANDHIFKGEDDGESMASLRDTTISSKLGDKIFRSSVTIVLISKGMRNPYVPESDQWIPWEVSYSLREQSRQGITSKTNAVLAVVIPDETGSYSYYIAEHPECNSTTYHTDRLFSILRDNMFNLRDKEKFVRYCNGSKIYEGNPSYIPSIKWDLFRRNIDWAIEGALLSRQNISSYDLVKKI